MVPVNFQLVRLAQQPRKLGLATSRIRRIVSGTTVCSQKGLPVQFVVEQGNHAQARRKGKTTTNKKNSGSLTPPPRGGGGRVVLPYLYGCVPLDRV